MKRASTIKTARSFKTIPEYRNMSSAQFFSDVVPAQQPIVIRGFVSNWPVVEAAKVSDSAFCQHLATHYNGSPITLSAAPFSPDENTNKRFFYNHDLSGFTFITAEEKLDLFLTRLLALHDHEKPPALSMQSSLVEDILPELLQQLACEFSFDAKPRIWVGNEGVVDTHYDGSDNLACVLAGRRRFVLFAPDQTCNLYPGPLDFTPAGVPVSLVNLREPDLQRYPQFTQALNNAYCVELEPGDAIYIPMLWWHNVESLSKVNGLINYWWTGSFAPDASAPNYIDSLKIALLAMRDMTPKQRGAWRCLFAHYLFKQGVDPESYIPKHQLHVLGDISKDYADAIKDYFVKKWQQ
jgi:mannose-6-phosphate isomerase-like protein (cupin superfamily)